MAKVLVVYGSRHGGTRGIAERIGEVLRTAGHQAEVEAAGLDADVRAAEADAVVVGSGVYMGNWLDQPLDFIKRNEALFATRPLWLFSSGPLTGSTAEKSPDDPVMDALGPAEGPGSGGRKKVEALIATTHPRDHRVFAGAFDPKDPPRALSERLVRMMPAKGLLPPGDFREWDAIEAWGREIAAAVVEEESLVSA